MPSPVTLADLLPDLTRLPDLPPVERAALAGRLTPQVRAAVAAVRHEAIHEATRSQTYGDVADALTALTGEEIGRDAVDRAVQEHRRNQRRRR